MFSPEYYAKLDPSYREALLKLQSDLQDIKNGPIAVMNFMENFMTSQKFWKMVPEKYSIFIETSFLSYEYLFFDPNHRQRPCSKYYGNNTETVPWELSYPHDELEANMVDWERRQTSFVPLEIRQRYKAMKELYSKIVAAENDLDEWISALMEAKNHRFVCDKIEMKLGADLTDKTLWKKYIDYLKEHDKKLHLETYSKYCRFFTGDEEMMEEYRQAAAVQSGLVSVPWKNPYDFEEFDAEFWNKQKEEYIKKYCNVNYIFRPVEEPLTIHFDGTNVRRQLFSFRPPSIDYILKNANGEVLQKLFKTCQWFGAAHPISVCYKFSELKSRRNEPLYIKAQSITSVNHSINNNNMNQLFFSTIFNYISRNSNGLSNLLPKIYRCTAKYIDIANQNLSLENLRFLIENAADLTLTNTRDADGNMFSLETILQLTPKIKRFQLCDIEYTAATSAMLCKLKFENQIEKIDLLYLNNKKLEPVEFGKFVTKNCSPKAAIKILFLLSQKETDWIDCFHQIIANVIKEIWTGDEKPTIEISRKI